MAKNNEITLLVILLVVLGLGIGYILLQEDHDYSTKSMNKDKKDTETVVSSSDSTFVEISAGQEVVKRNTVIISDKFVGEFSADGQVVVLDSTGSAFVVHDGVVLASNELVIDARNDQLSVVRLNERAKSVSSN
jgi:hypothetical protein